jgi:ABC-type antimicrobial peptide transport system permease subunit
VNLIDKELIIWSSPDSGKESFVNLFLYNNTCIISKAIADRLNINHIGAPIRLTFTDPQIEDDTGNTTIFQVVGITGGIPGFWNFRSSVMSASGGGIMVSLNDYLKYMNVKNAGKSNMIVDKAYINLRVNTELVAEDFKDDIETQYSHKDFSIDDSISKINDTKETNQSQSALMELILMFTVLISIFGLISNMFAVIKERKFEIGILRSMGLKTRNIRHMFLVESVIVMLSSALMGFLIGLLSAYLLESTMALITEMPVLFSIPWDTVMRVFIISSLAGIVGMYIILWNVSQQSVVEIFQQTF